MQIDIVIPHMIPFWNPWDIASTLEVRTGITNTIRNIRKVKHVQNMVLWRIVAVLMVFYHCTPTYDTFLESLGHCEYSGMVYMVTIRKTRRVKNVQNIGFWKILAVLMGI